MKKALIIFIIGSFISIFIYKICVQNKYDVLVIGDSIVTGDTKYGNSGITFNLFLKEYLKKKHLGNYNLSFSKNNLGLTNLLTNIKENIELNNNHIQKAIKDSELIIIAIGEDELVLNSEINNVNRIYRKKYYEDFKELLIYFRKITTSKILILGYYGDNINQIKEINLNIKQIANNYNCVYVELNKVINKGDYFLNNKIHLNYNGHQKIFNEIMKNL